MFYRRTGYPEEGELVLCTVTKIHFHSVFVRLDEYNRSGMIHISEISPGRIRNISDYVKEGKVVVCVVLRINREKDHIDLSLRRVNEIQKRLKTNTIKQEQIAEKIIEFVAEKLKKDPLKLYDEIAPSILERYDYLHTCFEELIEGKVKLTEFKIDKDVLPLLEEVIRQRIKPREVTIEGDLFLKTFVWDGIEVIKKALAEVQGVSNTIKIKYLGAGKYHLSITAKEYKDAEKTLKEAIDRGMKVVAATEGGEARFDRKE